MKVTADFVKGVAERRGCDRLAAYDRTGKFRFDYREGDVSDAVDDLMESTAGTFIVKLWKHSDKPGRKALADDQLSFMLQGRAQDESVSGMGGNGGGPGWREYIELREQLLRKELKEEADDKSDDVLGKVLPLVERLVVAGMNGKARPVAAVVAAPSAAQETAPRTGTPDDLREALAAVTLIYRRDRATFDQYAPHIRSAAETLITPATEEGAADTSDDDGE